MIEQELNTALVSSCCILLRQVNNLYFRNDFLISVTIGGLACQFSTPVSGTGVV